MSVVFSYRILPLIPSGYNYPFGVQLPLRGTTTLTGKSFSGYYPLRKDTKKVSLYPYTPIPRRGTGYYPYTPIPRRGIGVRCTPCLFGVRDIGRLVCSLFDRGEKDSGRLVCSLFVRILPVPLRGSIPTLFFSYFFVPGKASPIFLIGEKGKKGDFSYLFKGFLSVVFSIGGKRIPGDLSVVFSKSFFRIFSVVFVDFSSLFCSPCRRETT